MYGASQLARSPPSAAAAPTGCDRRPPAAAGPPASDGSPWTARSADRDADVAVLRRRVGDHRIGRIAARREAVAAAGAIPVARPDADGVLRAMRSAHRAVVLRSAADVVERHHVVHRDAVELRDRQVREVPPRAAFVPDLVETAVVAEHDVRCGRWGSARSRDDRRARRASGTCATSGRRRCSIRASCSSPRRCRGGSDRRRTRCSSPGRRS